MSFNIRKSFLLLVLLVASVIVSAQNKTDSNETDSQKRMTEFSKIKRHNLSLDVVAALIFPAFNPRYEYTLSKYSSIGGDLNINFDDDKGTENLEKFSFMPYFRQYFFSKEDYGAKGFYGEGFLKFYTFERDATGSFACSNNTITESYFEAALGVGIGWKWVSASGFLIDINTGLARNFGFADILDDYEFDYTGKLGVNFGWRF